MDEIFEGKSFQDLTKDIYDNANQKKKQIEILIKEMNKMISSIDEVILVAPIIKEYLEVSVKNDEHLVKLAGVLQRIISKSKGSDEESGLLSEAEKDELMVTLQETVNDMQLENDKIDNLKDQGRNVN